MDTVFPRFDDLLLKMAYDSICSGKQAKTILVAVEDYIGAMYILMKPEDIPEDYETHFEDDSEAENYVIDLLDSSDIFGDYPYVFEALKYITSAYTSEDPKKRTSLKSHLSGLELQQDFIDVFWSYLDNLEAKGNPEAIKEFEDNVFDSVIGRPGISAELFLSLGTDGIIENAMLEKLRFNSGDYGDISVDALLAYMNHFVKENVKAVDDYFDKEILTEKLRQMDNYGLIVCANDESYELTELGNSVLDLLGEYLSEHRDTGRLKPTILVDYDNNFLSYRANNHTYQFIASSKINPIVDALLSMGIYRIIEENPKLERVYSTLGYPDVSDHNLIKKLVDINFLKSTMGANHLTDDAEYFMINHLIPMLQELDDNPALGLRLRAKYKQYFTLHKALNKGSDKDVMFKRDPPIVEVVRKEAPSLEKAQESTEPVQQSSGASGSGASNVDSGQKEIQSTLGDIDSESLPEMPEARVDDSVVEQLLIEGSESPADVNKLLVVKDLSEDGNVESELDLPDVSEPVLSSIPEENVDDWLTEYEGREFPYGIHVNENVEVALDEKRENVIEILNSDGRISEEYLSFLCVFFTPDYNAIAGKVCQSGEGKVFYDAMSSLLDKELISKNKSGFVPGPNSVCALNDGLNFLLAFNNIDYTEKEIEIFEDLSSRDDVMNKIKYR